MFQWETILHLSKIAGSQISFLTCKKDWVWKIVQSQLFIIKSNTTFDWKYNNNVMQFDNHWDKFNLIMSNY